MLLFLPPALNPTACERTKAVRLGACAVHVVIKLTQASPISNALSKVTVALSEPRAVRSAWLVPFICRLPHCAIARFRSLDGQGHRLALR